MIVRDCDGNIRVILRNQCKNDTVYYEKMYYLRLYYEKKYKNVLVHIPKSNISISKTMINKDLHDD